MTSKQDTSPKNSSDPHTIQRAELNTHTGLAVLAQFMVATERYTDDRALAIIGPNLF